MSEVGMALGLTLLAGLATGIGSLLAFVARRSNYRLLAISTGFSAGVMLYVSFVELFPEGLAALSEVYGETRGAWWNACAFFGGLLLIGLIDNLVPEAENPHETRSDLEVEALHAPGMSPLSPSLMPPSQDTWPAPRKSAAHAARLKRMGLFTAFAIALHNFPEGLATFLAALHDPGLGVAIACAIALHNIPEGISVSVPIFYATGNRRQAFVYSLLSGLTEPLGALIAYVVLILFLGDAGAIPPEVMGVLFGIIAGIMVYISVDELLPTSRAYGQGHDSILGLVAGMMVMAVSLLLMA